MIFTEQQQKGQEILNTIIKKSWQDENFKQELITNPKVTITNLIGKPFNESSNLNVIVEDQTNSNSIYLNIPAKIKLDELELSEEQLNTISGGMTDPDDLGFFELVGYGLYLKYVEGWPI